jgi:hypothetical protein
MICGHCSGTGIITQQYIEGRSKDFPCGACVGTGRIDEVSFSLVEAGIIKRCLKLDGINEALLRDEAWPEVTMTDVDSFIERCKQIGVIS